MDLILTKNHITLTSCADIQSICESFFNATGLTYYNYVRLDDANQRICLSNNRAWMEYVFSTLDIHKITFEETPEHGQQRYVVWDNIETIGQDKLMTAAREEYNIAHGFTIIANYKDYVEYHYFGTSKENKAINNYYINHLNELNAFILYFKEQARDIIRAAEKQYITIDNPKFWMKGTTSEREAVFDKSAFSLTRYYLNGPFKSTYLTSREAECLTCLCDGLKAKEVGLVLGLSYRTIQKHIESIKQKLNCSVKKSLILRANQAGFEQISNIVRKNLKNKHRYYAY